MAWKLRDNQIFLLRPDLENIAESELSDGYAEISNNDSLLGEWVSLLDKVFPETGYTIDRVRHLLESDDWNINRVKLVAGNCEIVALSMAWHEAELWLHSGFVYWVAVLPEHQSQGLGTFVLNKVLKQIKSEGFDNAVTYTEESRLPAVRMYLKNGFVPLITGTVLDEWERWQRVADALDNQGFMSLVRDDYSQIAGNKIGNSSII